ncbi:MAG: DUF1501 domain-containing protein, partial [Planctomycetaceae bacterium]|nr:DUF1501 domain-containing protein [Planctomycetaceae bacterium]
VRGNASAKAAIFINLQGGPSHLDTFDPKPQAPAEMRGEFQAIQTSVPGIELCEHLPKLAATMNRFTILRNVTHTLAAHQLGTEYINTGNRPLPSIEFPGYGAVVSKELGGPPELPPFVSIPTSAQRAGFLGVQYAPLHTNTTPKAGEPYSVRGISLQNGLTVEAVEKRENLLHRLDTAFAGFEQNSQLLQGLDRFSQQAYTMITSTQAREAFDVSQESPAYTQKFGETPFGQSCLLATRLVASGVRFVTIGNNGWDTHQENWTKLKDTLLPPVDEGLSALLIGLEEKGLLDSTIVFVSGEFGRTPKINTDRGGRDHYPRAMFMLMAGGGVRGGRVIGATTADGSEPDGDSHTPDDAAATFYHTLGIDHQQEYQTNTGRPVMIVRDGKVIEELFV